MKVKQLIAELQKQNPEAYVTDMNRRGVTQLISTTAFLEDASTVDAELVLLNYITAVKPNTRPSTHAGGFEKFI